MKFSLPDIFSKVMMGKIERQEVQIRELKEKGMEEGCQKVPKPEDGKSF